MNVFLHAKFLLTETVQQLSWAPSLSSVKTFRQPDSLSADPSSDPDCAFVQVSESSENTGNQIPNLHAVYQSNKQNLH